MRRTYAFHKGEDQGEVHPKGGAVLWRDGLALEYVGPYAALEDVTTLNLVLLDCIARHGQQLMKDNQEEGDDCGGGLRVGKRSDDELA